MMVQSCSLVWREACPEILENQIPEMPRKQVEGSKLGIEVLQPESLNKLISYYREDYDTFPGLDRDRIRAEWLERVKAVAEEAEREPVRDRTLLVKKFESPKVQLFWLAKDSVRANSDGFVEPLIGAVLLHSDETNEYHLCCSDARGSVTVEWTHPSPRLATRFPDNPHAERARFSVDGLRISPEKAVELYLVNPNGHGELLCRMKIPDPID